MVEYVKHLRPKLQVQPLRKFGVLDYREIRVDEVRARQAVAADVSGMATAEDEGLRGSGSASVKGAGNCEHRRSVGRAVRNHKRKPRGRAVVVLAQAARRTVTVELLRSMPSGNRPDCIRSQIEGCGPKIYLNERSHRIAALQHLDRAYFPAANPAIVFRERQLVESAQHEAVTGVKFRQPVIATRIVRVLHRHGVAGAD